MNYREEKQFHHDLSYIGLRAQATAAGFLQLSIELRKSGAINDAATARIKDVIVRELALMGPRSTRTCTKHEKDMRGRLDRLFDGQEEVGAANAQTMAAYDHIVATPSGGA